MSALEKILKEKLRLVSDRDVTLEPSEAGIYNIHTADILSIEDQILESEESNGK